MTKDITKDNELLVPAMQKMYSALRHLKMFNKSNNFFENISSIDAFLSEFRNITFVLQKSVAHTEYSDLYILLCNKHLKNNECEWLKNKRNETIKEHPFHLSKQISITVYENQSAYTMERRNFEMDTDVPVDVLTSSLRTYLLAFQKLEVHFSIEYQFYDADDGKNLFGIIHPACEKMFAFLQNVNEHINDNSAACKELMSKVEMLMKEVVAQDLFRIDDYVYIVSKDRFERASQFRFLHPGMNARMPLFVFEKRFNVEVNQANSVWQCFCRFATLHTTVYMLQEKHLMPTFFVIYNDNTFQIKTFESSLRTTMYRYINDIANEIKESKEIKAVFFANEMLKYTTLDAFNFDYEERRLKCSYEDYLYFYYMTESDNKLIALKSKDLNGESDTSWKYFASHLMKSDDIERVHFIQPIINALNNE